MDQEKIGKFIAERRKLKHYTQEELGNIVGVSRKSVSKWECGNNLPDISLLEPLSELLGITPNDLLHGEIVDIKNQENVDISSMKYYNEKTKNKYSVCITFLVLFLIAFFSFVFLINNYNKCRVYKISSNDKNYYVSGYTVLNQDNILIIVNEIRPISKTTKKVANVKIKSAEIHLKSNDTILLITKYENEKEKDYKNLLEILKNMHFNYEDINKEKNFNSRKYLKLKIEIYYVTSTGKEDSISINLKTIEKFSNNKLF